MNPQFDWLSSILVGDVSTKDRLLAYSMPEPNSGCWLWLRQVSNFGYGMVSTHNGSKFAHRMSYEVFVGPIPEGMSVLHKCDQPACMNPDHLFLGTDADNIADMIKKGRGRLQTDPESSPRRKLNREQVLYIRSQAGKKTQQQLAEELGVVHGHVGRIQRGVSWRWLTDDAMQAAE